MFIIACGSVCLVCRVRLYVRHFLTSYTDGGRVASRPRCTITSVGLAFRRVGASRVAIAAASAPASASSRRRRSRRPLFGHEYFDGCRDCGACNSFCDCFKRARAGGGVWRAMPRPRGRGRARALLGAAAWLCAPASSRHTILYYTILYYTIL